MKIAALLTLLVVLALGFYLNQDTTKDTQVLIEDSVESSMAAPTRPDLPL